MADHTTARPAAERGEPSIIVALARCAMGNAPTPAVRRQVERLHEAWAARGDERADQLARLLDPSLVPDELRDVRIVHAAAERGDVSRSDMEKRAAYLRELLDASFGEATTEAELRALMEQSDCECEECRECGEMPCDCSGTDCAATCSCSTCLTCRSEHYFATYPPCGAADDPLQATMTRLYENGTVNLTDCDRIAAALTERDALAAEVAAAREREQKFAALFDRATTELTEARASEARHRADWDARSREGREQVRRLVEQNNELRRALAAARAERERAEGEVARWRQTASEVLAVLAGAGFCTPEGTYRDDPPLLAVDVARAIRDLRKEAVAERERGAGECIDFGLVKADAIRGGLPDDVYRFAMNLVERTVIACEQARANREPLALNYGTLLEETAKQTMAREEVGRG